MFDIRLDKYLANNNVGSRSDVTKSIRKGLVTVNGEVVKDNGYKLKEDDKVEYLGRVVNNIGDVYIMMNKPSGVLTATQDNYEKTVVDLLSDDMKKLELFPVGRLDKDTVGLLILTNNGNFSHNTLSPKKHVEKEYWVEIDKAITEEDIKLFETGIVFRDGTKCKPAKLEILNNVIPAHAKITISEGKFHQVKKMFRVIDANVMYLKRTKFAGLELDESLRQGEYRLLSDTELDIIKEYV